MDTKEIFTSLVECCDAGDLNYGSMKNRLRGVTRNKTPYAYINDLDEPISKYNEDMSYIKHTCVGGKNCIDIITKQVYACIREASDAIGCKKGYIKNRYNAKKI